jgi:lipopolysaccharide export system protein LptA
LALALAFAVQAAPPGFAADAPKHPAKPAPADQPAVVQPAAPAASDAAKPEQRDEGTLEVTSDRDLEWLQQDHAYVARGNAVAKRGAVTLMGDTLIAYYRPLQTAGRPAAATEVSSKPGNVGQAGFDSGNTEIWRVIAIGHVHVLSDDKDAWGDRAEYDKDKSVFVLTGNNLRASTLEDVVTARDSLEYWQDKDMAVARGNAVITKVNGNTLSGDLIGGHFVKDQHGTSQLKTIESKGHVVVTTATDVVHGDEGVYDLDGKRTVLFGNVRATRGGSTLEGESADVNMETGISQVFPGLGQRVHGLFVRQNQTQSQAAPAADGKH